MTSPVPALLLDTCAIINLSYCAPVAALFRDRYQGTAGWLRVRASSTAQSYPAESAGRTRQQLGRHLARHAH